MKNNINGMAWMFYASILLSCSSIIMSMISVSVNVFQIFFIATLLGVIMSFFAINSTSRKFTTKTLPYYALRGLFSTMTLTMWGYVLTKVPVAEATAISYITPLLNIIAAILILKEKLNVKGFLLVVLGFLGAMMVLRPGLDGFNSGYILALITTLVWMVSDILTKVQIKSEPPLLHCFYLNIFMFLFSLPFAIYFWQSITFIEFLGIIGFSIVQFLNIFCFLQAYYKADLVVVTPIDFSRIIISSVWSYLFLGEPVSWYSIIGSVVIFFSVILFCLRESEKTIYGTMINLLPSTVKLLSFLRKLMPSKHSSILVLLTRILKS